MPTTPSGRDRRQATASRCSARGSGTATTTGPTGRRRSSIRSARPGSHAIRVSRHRRASGAKQRPTSSSRPTRRPRAWQHSAPIRRRDRTSSRRARTPLPHGFRSTAATTSAPARPCPHRRARTSCGASSIAAASTRRPSPSSAATTAALRCASRSQPPTTSASSSRSRSTSAGRSRSRSSICACTSTGSSSAARWTRAARPISRPAPTRASRSCSGRSRLGRGNGS